MYFDEFIKQHVEAPKNLNKTSFSVSQTADAQTDGITLYNPLLSLSENIRHF